MNRSVRSTHGLVYFPCTLILLLIITSTAQGQQKPAAAWVDLDLTSKVAAKGDVVKEEVVKTAPSIAIKPREQKSIWREPAWYVALGGSVVDIAGSIASVDGKRVSEGNPLARRSDGNVAWERLLPLKAVSLLLQYRAYKNPKHRKLAIVSMVATGVLHAALGGGRGFAKR